MTDGGTKASVKFDAVQKSFGSVKVLEEFNLKVQPGEFLVLLGASGSGKTTALRILSGLETPSAGQVYIGERDVTEVLPKYRDISMVFQSYALYPHKTVASNMAFSLRMKGMDKAEIKARVDRAAEVLGLTPYLRRYPRALSGGQRQRVAMGRAIVRDPQVFLFDEPLSNLDAKLRVQMRAEIRELHQRLKSTTVYVTHDQIEAMTMADKIVVMQNGHIEQVGSPLELYDSPANTFVAGFIGSPAMNMIKASVSIDPTAGPQALIGEAFLNLPLVASLKAGQEVLIGIRPENLLPAADGIAGEITVIEPTGSETHIVVRSDGQDFVSVLRERPEYQPGQSIKLLAAVEDLHVFDADSLRCLNDPH